MKPAINRASVDAVLSYVHAHADCSVREIAVAVFGSGAVRSTELSYAHQILRVLEARGEVQSDEAPPRHANSAPYRTYRAPDGLPPAVGRVVLSTDQLWLVVHVLERLVDDGVLVSDATKAVLVHLQREHVRLEAERVAKYSDPPARAGGER
jgi:hypothetical protein